ncbi:MAG: hypothetical protein ACTS7I_02315 [Candidatus Hodgkinia cicadicola]
MNQKSLVIADQHAAVNTFSGPVHTARHTMGAGSVGSVRKNSGSILGISSGFFRGREVWNGVPSASWSEMRSCSIIKKQRHYQDLSTGNNGWRDWRHADHMSHDHRSLLVLSCRQQTRAYSMKWRWWRWWW